MSPRDQARKRRSARRRLAFAAAKGLFRSDFPILEHMVPMRRCNLACNYCNEYDDSSPPVPTETMLAQIDHLASLGTRIITFSGGEPLLHPDLDLFYRRIKSYGIFAELLTNGYLLSPDRIRRLNDAGLDRLQISIDNVAPDEISKKSLKVLDRKLVHLAEHALFDVNINSVVGAGVDHARDALHITGRAVGLGFSSTVGIIHDGTGQSKPLGPEEREVYVRIRHQTRFGFGPFVRFKDNLAEGKPNAWKCRAGARYLYICENGLVHYCSQQRGAPGVPLLEYTAQDIRREFNTHKSCAPMCTVSCVHAISPIDAWRGRQTDIAAFGVPPAPLAKDIVQIGDRDRAQ